MPFTLSAYLPKLESSRLERSVSLYASLNGARYEHRKASVQHGLINIHAPRLCSHETLDSISAPRATTTETILQSTGLTVLQGCTQFSTCVHTVCISLGTRTETALATVGGSFTPHHNTSPTLKLDKARRRASSRILKVFSRRYVRPLSSYSYLTISHLTISQVSRTVTYDDRDTQHHMTVSNPTYSESCLNDDRQLCAAPVVQPFPQNMHCLARVLINSSELSSKFIGGCELIWSLIVDRRLNAQLSQMQCHTIWVYMIRVPIFC